MIKRWIYSPFIVLAVITACTLFSSPGRAAMDPALAAKADRVRAQMESRITPEKREAAAAVLKAERLSIDAAPAAAPDSLSAPARARLAPVAGPLPIPTGPFNADGTPAVPDYNTTPNWAFSPPLAKFVDTLPGLGSQNANNLGAYIPVAVPDVTTYPGSDYYEIDLVEYTQQLHSDMPNGTRLRGYVQVNRGSNLSAGHLPSENLCGDDNHPCREADTLVSGVVPAPVKYLGPAIVAERDRPVRIKFTNRLGTGPDGDLFIPVDTSVMGAGSGPAYDGGGRGNGLPCDNTVEGNSCAQYTQNRATIHLHGGRTPWISDGTPHQWVTPADEKTPYPQGVSVKNVPDMPDPGDGSMTFFYTNQQSARLMFYHDHAFGITRLNVYAGEAAGYLITDRFEKELVDQGLIPPDQIPLIIQDRTFVDATPVTHPETGETVPTIRVTDPLWNWGSGPVDAQGVRSPVTGDLWLPHVYVPAQNPYNPDYSGTNPFGRWLYGPWFYPPTVIKHPPVDNPYYDPNCSSPDPILYLSCSAPGQPPKIPATPHPSMGMEAFLDTAVVNGTPFPVLEVDARAYRFRILNAANDRGLNLSLFKADQGQLSPDNRTLSPYTEVKMVPASPELARANGWPALWPTDGREGGVPDPATAGPSWLQIGTEGGFLPKPVIRAPQPLNYITDPTAFWVGVVKDTSLALMPAERADVIVDFTGLEGQTLILYNDAPTAWPALDSRYDYYTGAPDQRDTGGYGAGGVYDPVTKTYSGGHATLAGYGPNTRTIMQIVVRTTPQDAPYAFSPARLQEVFVPTQVDPQTGVKPKSLFARAQEPIIVGQPAYKEVYPETYFPPNWPWSGIRSSMLERSLQFVTTEGKKVVVPLEPKGIHDEMGASFDPEYGRMSGNISMELPNPTTNNANLILYGFSDLPTETIFDSTAPNVQVNVDQTLADGTQIWNISHNGVDTHPIHFHIFDVQLINRIGWDGQIALPDPNELGWKDTVRISPLMDTIVAVRPRSPALPFGIPDSLRPLNPAIPINSPMGFSNIDPATGQAYAPPSPYAGGVANLLYNFSWEYVWHCHILSHEEMDMMRPIVLKVQTDLPAAPTLTVASMAPGEVRLSWTDPTPVNYLDPKSFGNPANEIGFRLERCSGSDCTDFAPLAAVEANKTVFVDQNVNGTYRYRVHAYTAKGPGSLSNTVSSAVPAVSFKASPLASATVGTQVQLTAGGVGGIGNYEYQFRLVKADGTVILRPYTTDPICLWDTSGLTAGNYVLGVWVRNVGATVPYEARKTIGYALVAAAPVSSVNLISSVASPVIAGTTVLFNAQAFGGSQNYQYQYQLVSGTGKTILQAYSPTAALIWNTAALAPGSYTIVVYAKNQGSTAAFEVSASLPYSVVAAPPASGATLTAAPVAPITAGTVVTLQAGATGGSGTYEYQFTLLMPAPAKIVQAYGPSSAYLWQTAGLPPGDYKFVVWVRNAGSAAKYESYKFLQLTLK